MQEVAAVVSDLIALGRAENYPQGHTWTSLLRELLRDLRREGAQGPANVAAEEGAAAVGAGAAATP